MSRGLSATHRGSLLLLASSVLAGLAPCGTRLALLSSLPPLQLQTFRFAVLAMLVGLMFHRRFDARTVSGRSVWRLCGLALLLTAEHALYLLALTHAPVSVVTPLFFSYPAIVTAVQLVKRQRRFHPVLLLSLVLSLAGVTLTAYSGWGDIRLIGLVLAIASGAACAALILLSASLLTELGEPLTLLGMAALAIPLSAGIAWFGAPLPSSVSLLGLLGVLVSGVLYAGSAILFFLGMGQTGATTAALLSTLEPAVAVVVGFLLLGEPMSRMAVVGAAITVSALILASMQSAHAQPES